MKKAIIITSIVIVAGFASYFLYKRIQHNKIAKELDDIANKAGF